MQILLTLLLVLPCTAAPPAASASADAPAARQDVQGKKGKKKQRKQREKTEGKSGDEAAAPRKRKPRQPLEVVPKGTERRAKREAEGLKGAGRIDGARSRKSEKTPAPPTKPISVTRGEDDAAVEGARPEDAKGRRGPAPAGLERSNRPGPTAKRGRAELPTLAAELRTHWSRLARLDQLSQIFLEGGSMEAYQRADRLRSIENERFHTAMAALRERLGPERVDGVLQKLQSRGGKWGRSDWVRGEGKRLK